MGLAIRAVCNVSFVSADYAECWGHRDRISISTFNAGFSERLDGLPGGVYLVGANPIRVKLRKSQNKRGNCFCADRR